MPLLPPYNLVNGARASAATAVPCQPAAALTTSAVDRVAQCLSSRWTTWAQTLPTSCDSLAPSKRSDPTSPSPLCSQAVARPRGARVGSIVGSSHQGPPQAAAVGAQQSHARSPHGWHCIGGSATALAREPAPASPASRTMVLTSRVRIRADLRIRARHRTPLVPQQVCR